MKPRTDNTDLWPLLNVPLLGAVVAVYVALTPWGCAPPASQPAPQPPAQPAAEQAPVRNDWPLVRGDANATGAVVGNLRRPLAVLWTYDTKSRIDATAAIVDGIVYVGDGDGTFHAVKLADGSNIWTKTFDETGFVAGSAVVDGAIYCVDFNNVVRRLNAANGDEMWKVDTETSLYSAPNVVDGRVLIVGDSGDLWSLDPATGNEQWKFSIDQPLRAWPTVVGGRVLVAGCDGKMHAVDIATGDDVEKIDIGGPADGMPAVLGDNVYFCTAGGLFHAMTIKPLAEVWRFGQKGQSEEIHAAAVTEQAVVLGTHDKTVVALNPKTGGPPLWTFPLAARAESSPVIVGDLAFAGTIRGRVHAIDMATGAEVWETDFGGRFTASPAVSDGRIVIGNEDGVLYCIGSKP